MRINQFNELKALRRVSDTWHLFQVLMLSFFMSYNYPQRLRVGLGHSNSKDYSTNLECQATALDGSSSLKPALVVT